MKYFVPHLELSSDLPPQTQLEDKLGGLPWGLTPEQYPICEYCGKSQSLLAQFVHHPERLDLGKAGRTLLVFQCNHNPGQCPTWEGGAGANACLIFEGDELSDRLAEMPEDQPSLQPEARIMEWLVKEDGIAPENSAAFYADETLWDLPEKMQETVYPDTKLGSVPQWIQSASEAPADGWKFMGQLSYAYTFLEEPTAQSGVYIYPLGQEWGCDGPNFGDGGIGYIFVRQGAGKPEGWFFWQCS